MALKTKAPSAGMPSFVAGDTVRFQTGTHPMSAAIRVPMNGVTFEFEKGVILDGRKAVGNAFYLNGGDDTKLVALDLAVKPKLVNYTETTVYCSRADRFLMRGIYTGFSGNDSGSSYLDHGIYIDGCLDFIVEDHESEGITAHGIQVYSGASVTTRGIIRRARLHHNRGDGLHVGNAATGCTFTQIEAYGNKHWGLRFYSGTGSKLVGPNWSYANANGPIYVDRTAANPSPKEFLTTAPPAVPVPEPPPTPEPEPPPTDPCGPIKVELAAMTARARAAEEKLAAVKAIVA